MSILLPQKWKRQPRIGVRVDPSNPINRNLIGSWPMSAMGVVRDASQYNRNSNTITPTNASWQTGVNGTELKFNGSQAVGDVSWGDVTWFDGLTTLTIEADFLFTSGAIILGKWGATNPEASIILGTGNYSGGVSGALLWGVYLASGQYRIWNTAASTLVSGSRYHVVVSWSGSNNATVFINGKKTAWAATPAADATGIANSTGSFAFGADTITTAGRKFVGSIGMVNAWSRALTDAEAFQRWADRWGIFIPSSGIPVAFDTGGGAQTLTPSLYTNDQTFYSPTVTPGAVTLSPSLYTNQQTFYGPTLTATVTVSPSLYTNQQIFYGPTATPGTVTLQPALYTNTQSFYTPSVNQTGAVVYPSLFTNTNIFFAAEAINEYPDPSQVEFGVKYGPGGTLVGTLTGGGGSSIIRLRSFTERH